MNQLKKEELVAKILEAEWDMFHNTHNIGGIAACQEDRKTFEINRSAQAMSWSDAALGSYLNDLLEAQKNKRNLVARDTAA